MPGLEGPERKNHDEREAGEIAAATPPPLSKNPNSSNKNRTADISACSDDPQAQWSSLGKNRKRPAGGAFAILARRTGYDLHFARREASS